MPTDNGIVSVVLSDKEAVYAAYMPFLKHGGLFIATTTQYPLGEKLSVEVSLPGQTPVTIASTVVWVTPESAAKGKRSIGIGVQFDEKEGAALNAKLIALTADNENNQPTHTL